MTAQANGHSMGAGLPSLVLAAVSDAARTDEPRAVATIPRTVVSTGRRDAGTDRAAEPADQAIDAGTVIRLLEAAGVRQVRLEFADLHGISRCKLVPLPHFASVVAKGTAFYGGILHRSTAGRMAVTYTLPDYTLRPDLTTLAVLDPAHGPGLARVVCDLRGLDGAFSPFSPRTAVRRLVASYADLGYRPRLGFEYEFYLSAADGEPIFPDNQYAATLRALFDPAFAEALVAALARLGIEAEGFFVEAGRGQLEIPLPPADGLAAADAAFAFRTTVKELAARHGYRASFMTKPRIDEPNSALHVHQSLIGLGTGANAFATADGAAGLSPLAQRYLAGQLAHAPALTAFLDPTVNCPKSFRPHSCAPSNVSWGWDNRYVAIRVPSATGAATRLENRIGGAAADPYLAAAALLAAGLDGIRRDLPLPAPSSGDVTTASDLPPLPRTLDAALDALDADEALRALLPAELVELFLAVKRDEVARCRAAVPDYGTPSFGDRIDPWEIREYGELI